MKAASGVIVYVILWWVVFYCVLPIGIRPANEGDLGHDAGAPANPMLWRKVAITTVIAAVLSGVAYAIINSDLMSFRYQ